MNAQTRSEYTGRRPGPALAVVVFAVGVGLSLARPAAADEADWHAVPLPGGRAALLPRLGLSPDLPRALVIGEIVRVVHEARDPHGRPPVALAAYFAEPPAAGDEMVPLPLAPSVWRATFIRRDVPDRDLLGVILTDRRLALICYGLLGLDAETRRFLVSHLAILANMSERDASVFASFADVLHVRDGALQLPGIPGAVLPWSALIGEPTTDARSAIPALLARDNGRLAYFAEAVAALDPSRLALIFPPGASVEIQLASARTIYRSFVSVDQARNLAELTFQRLAYGPGDLLEALPLGPGGVIDGPDEYWRAIFDGDDVPAKEPAAWKDFDTRAAAAPAPLLDRLAQESFPGRRELLGTVYFVGRLTTRFPSASLADRVLLAHAFRRYPALLLTLERIGVDDLAIWHSLVQQARTLDARLGGSTEIDVRCALLQAPLALIDRAVQVHAIDRRQASVLLARLAAVDPGVPATGRVVARWIDTFFLPALGGSAVGGGEAESRLLERLAGLTAPGSGVQAMTRVQWEDFSYRVDPAAAEIVRLRDVRQRQGGNTLDTALELARAGSTLAGPSDSQARKGAVQALRNVRQALEPLDEREGSPAIPVDVGRIVDQAVTDGARAQADPSRAAGIAEHLSRAEDVVVADVLTSIVYALWLGDPEGQVFLGGNVAQRHDFGRRSSTPAERERARWMVPVEASGGGEPWHVRGALLALDIGLGRLALRRTNGDLPIQQPRLSEADRRAMLTSLVLMPSLDADQASTDTLLAWLTAGRKAASQLAAPDRLAEAAARLGLDSRRQEAVHWTAVDDSANVPSLFLLTELVQLGRPAGAQAPAGWGPAETSLTGCLCRSFPDPDAPHRASGLGGTGLLAARIDDLELFLLERLATLHLPAALAKGVVASALQDYLDSARPAYGGDWWTLGKRARTLSDERVLDYVSALTAGGPLVPVEQPSSTDGHP